MLVDIIRAWKDPEYRQSLSGAERVMVAPHPAGFTDLTEEEIRAVSGGGPDGGTSPDGGTGSPKPIEWPKPKDPPPTCPNSGCHK
jgi:mersacidin/lichenicidin family type 2 lantibiotic